MKNDNTIEYIECKCDDVSHLIRIVFDKYRFQEDNFYEDDDSGIYIETQLSCYLPLLERIWCAIKYIFKYDRRYGHWDCTLLNMEDVKKLNKLFEKVIEENKEYEKIIEKKKKVKLYSHSEVKINDN